MNRFILVLSCFVFLALEVSCESGGNIIEDGNKSEELGRHLEEIIKSDAFKTEEVPKKIISEDDDDEQEDSEENDASHENSKRSYGGYRSTGSYNKLLPSWMTMNHLVDSLVRAHLRGMIVKKLRQEQHAKAELDRMNSDDCRGLVIKSVGYPIIHNTYGAHGYGAWMKDPLEYLGPGRIWIMDGYYNQKLVKEFASYTDFKAGIVFKTHRLPYYWDGTGAVVYGPYLYYNRYSSNYIVKYDLRNDRMVTQRSHGYYNKVRSYYYNSGGYNGMDLAVDESGLWVLAGYSGYSGRLSAAMIDTTTLVTRHVWNAGGETQRSMGNAFVACGVVYMVDTYSGTTTINRAYDTRTGKSWNPNILFKWHRSSYGTSLSYNPKEKMLYSWGNHHQVTYSLKFGKKV